MNQANKLTEIKLLKKRLNFAGDLARYRELLTEMDQAEHVGGKIILFRQLAGLLATMETGIWSEA